MILKRLFSISLIKTIRFNIHYFSIREAMKLPAIVYRHVTLHNMGGAIIVKSPIKTGMLQIGSKNVSIIGKEYKTIWDCQGKVFIGCKVFIGIGSCISIGKDGSLFLGDNFALTARSTIDCQKEIRFGNNCLLSWDILVMDSDYHYIYNKDGVSINAPRPIIIGNHVWMGCRTTVLKGTILPDHTIVAAGSIVAKKIQTPNTIVGGSGQSLGVLKENVSWQQ